MTLKKGDKFTTKLKMLRLEKGMTQGEIANELGISRGCLANYETGKRSPDGDMLKKLAQVLNVSIDFLMTGSDVRSVTLNEEELKVYTKANEKLKEYGDIINLNEVNVISRIQLVDFFQYLKEKEKREEYL